MMPGRWHPAETIQITSCLALVASCVLGTILGSLLVCLVGYSVWKFSILFPGHKIEEGVVDSERLLVYFPSPHIHYIHGDEQTQQGRVAESSGTGAFIRWTRSSFPVAPRQCQVLSCILPLPPWLTCSLLHSHF